MRCIWCFQFRSMVSSTPWKQKGMSGATYWALVFISLFFSQDVDQGPERLSPCTCLLMALYVTCYFGFASGYDELC